MKPIKLVAALLGTGFASRSIARRRRPVAPQWRSRDWLLEDRRLLTVSVPTALAAPHNAAIVQEIPAHAPQTLERIHHETPTSAHAARATDDAGKGTLPSDGSQKSEGKKACGEEAPAPDTTGGEERDSDHGPSDSPVAPRPKYAIASTDARYGSTSAAHSPTVSSGLGGVSTTAAPEETATPTQAHSGIVQGAGSSSQIAHPELVDDTHGGPLNKTSQSVEDPSGPTVADLHEVPSGTGTASDAPRASDATEHRFTPTEMPSLSGLDHAARAFVTAIYGATFDRLPEVVELKLWSRHLKAGVDPRLVAWRIWTSPEHRRLQRHGMVEPKEFQRAYEAAAAAGRRARRDQLSPPTGPLPLTARGPSPTSAGASLTSGSQPASPQPAADRRSRFKIGPR